MGIPVTVLTFEQWKIENPDLVETQEECASCGGTGTCTRLECGTEHECGTCDGTGAISEGGTLRDQYLQQVKKDKERLAKFQRLVGQVS